MPGSGKGSVSTETVVRPVQVGDIFVSSWGYDQTNIDYYVVESVTKSGKSVKVHKIGSKVVGASGTSDKVVPDPSVRASFNGETVLRRLKHTTWRGEAQTLPYFSVASYANAYQWDGQADYETNALFGH